MIAAQYYYDIYLLIVTILSLFAISKYGLYSADRLNDTFAEPIGPSLLLCIFMILFIGTRPISGRYFVDMEGTAAMWPLYDTGTFSFSWDVENKLYDNLRYYMSTAGYPVETFFVLIAAIYFSAMLGACRKFFPKDTLFAYLVFLAAFSTFSYSTNGIKAGSAASIFMLALAYHDKPIVTIILSLISWGFHHSMVMVVASYLIVYIYHKPKWFFVLWIFSVFIAAAHIGTFQSFFASMTDERGESYLTSMVFEQGFRIDFILYSAMPVLVGYYALYKKEIQSRSYEIILCLYLMTNAIWMLCMYSEASNRIAYLSWLQYPVVLIYPFLNENWGTNQYSTVKKVAYGHLAFTLFMVFIYYGTLHLHH